MSVYLVLIPHLTGDVAEYYPAEASVYPLDDGMVVINVTYYGIEVKQALLKHTKRKWNLDARRKGMERVRLLNGNYTSLTVALV